MQTNIKSIFFVLTILTLLLAVSAVSAADDDATDAVSQTPATVSDVSSDVISTEQVQTSSSDNSVITENEVTKKVDKNIKTETSTVDVSNYNGLYNAVRDATDENIIINLGSGDYYVPWETWSFNNENVKKVTINGNNNSMSGSWTLSTTYEFEINNLNIGSNFISNNLKNVTIDSSTIKGYTFTNRGNITVKNTNITDYGQSYNENGNMTIINSIFNRTVNNNGNSTLFISDDTTLGSNFGINGVGEVITNQTILPYMNTYTGNITMEDCALSGTKTNEGTLTLNNVNLTAYMTNNGNLTINSSSINSGIVNNGNLTISDDTELGTNYYIVNNGNILSDINRLIPYFNTYNGNYTIENITFKGYKTNNGNLTIINSYISSLANNGNLTIQNTTLNGTISNNGVLIIDEDSVFESSFQYQGNGEIIIDDMSRIVPYMSEYRGNYTIINATVNGNKNNYGNLTFINSTCNAGVNINQGSVTFINSIINGTISAGQRNTELIIDDDTTFGDGFRLNGGYGLIIMNNTERLIPYLIYSVPNGNITIKEYNLTKSLQNFGNTTIIDSNVTARYTNAANTTIINSYMTELNNNGNLYIYNSTLNGTLTNNNNRYLLIDDNTVFAEGFRFKNYGTLILNDTNKIYPYTASFNGTSHLTNLTINKIITNYGNLTLTNVTINQTIRNPGTLIIEDDVVFAEKAGLVTTGLIIINDTNKIYPYISTFKTDGKLSDLTINKKITNQAELTLDNCILNNTIENYGTLIITDDTTFDENFILTGSGEIIINDTSRILPYLTMTATEIELADSNTGVQYAPTTIKAYITDEYGYNINSGEVKFTDEEDNLIAETTVENGVATATATFTKATQITINAYYTPTNIILLNSSTTGTIEIQSPETIITINEITAKAGETVTLTAQVTDQLENNITGGKVTFKVNGKTLKDDNGKVIYAKVTDGVATADYLVPTNLGGKDITITAVYSGNSKYAKQTATTTTTVEKAVPTFTTESVTATAGESVTLSATITDGDNIINTGKVVFKINGKTLKDANGKVIYAKVSNNQVNFTYTIPEDMKAKEYNLTATLISSDYDRLEDTKTLTIN